METAFPEGTDTDAELVARARAGEMTAFDSLITRHRARVHSMITTIVRNEADAWDVSQEVFLRAWRNLARFRSDSTFATWLHRIATNCALDWLRRVRVRPLFLADSPSGEPDGLRAIDNTVATEPSPRAAAENAELRQRINAALERLSPAHRTVLLLKEVEGLKYDEIARNMNCSIGTVMSRLFHARKNMQRILSETDAKAGS
jgi:RNA polymerase sigma-70 factor (ECF subfamily)